MKGSVGIIMMMGKKTACFFLVLVFAVAGIYASFATRPSVSASFGAVFCHPTADYLKEYPGDPSVDIPAFRTSRSFGFDLDLLNLSFGFGGDPDRAIQFGIGLTYVNVSESLPFGLSVLKPYHGLGVLANVNWRINRYFDLGFRYRFLPCRFTKSETRFLVQDFELVPAYRMISFKALDIFVSMPLTASWKADAVSFRTSVALILSMDSGRMVSR